MPPSLQLALCVWCWDAEAGKEVENPHADHVHVLWRMGRDKRMQVWRGRGRFEEVVELELGGWGGCECPMDAKELLVLLPEGRGALAGLRNLFLRDCAVQVSDRLLRTLASAGCGESLTSLTLGCEWFFFPVLASNAWCVGWEWPAKV